jgi:hypothetical protein
VNDNETDTENPEPTPYPAPPLEEGPSDTGLVADDEAAVVDDEDAG